MIKSQVDNNEVKAKGTHLISICKIVTDKAKHLLRLLDDVKNRREYLIEFDLLNEQSAKDLWTEYNYYLKQLHKSYLQRQYLIENLTVNVGRGVLAQRLAGINTYSGNVNYGAVGTDATSPTLSDTLLGAETYRKALSSGYVLNQTAYLENFYNPLDFNGTVEEFGFFIDGTGSADTGQLFNRFTETVTKSNIESLNVQSNIQFNDA